MMREKQPGRERGDVEEGKRPLRKRDAVRVSERGGGGKEKRWTAARRWDYEDGWVRREGEAEKKDETRSGGCGCGQEGKCRGEKAA